jgi:hypothetical protein
VKARGYFEWHYGSGYLPPQARQTKFRLYEVLTKNTHLLLEKAKTNTKKLAGTAVMLLSRCAGTKQKDVSLWSSPGARRSTQNTSRV